MRDNIILAHKFGSGRRLVLLWLHRDDLYRISRSPDKAWIHGSPLLVVYKKTHYPHYDLHVHPATVLL